MTTIRSNMTPTEQAHVWLTFSLMSDVQASIEIGAQVAGMPNETDITTLNILNNSKNHLMHVMYNWTEKEQGHAMLAWMDKDLCKEDIR